MKTFQESLVFDPVRASIEKCGSKDGEDEPERNTDPSIESPGGVGDVEDPPPPEIEDPSVEEEEPERSRSVSQQQIAPPPPPSPLAKVKRSPTMRERITSLPRRIISMIGVESAIDGTEEVDWDSKCEVAEGKLIYQLIMINNSKKNLR